MKVTLERPLLFFLMSFSACLYAGQWEDNHTLLDKLHITMVSNDDWIQELNVAGVLTQSRKKPSIEVKHQDMPLFKQYPQLVGKLPYTFLGNFPTPIMKLTNLSLKPGYPTIYVKRDDLTGTQDEYGGNKVRKLEPLFGEALMHGATEIITLGWAGSNSAVATSAYAKKLGLKCTCMLKPQDNSSLLQKNLLLHNYYATELYYYPDNNWRKLGTITLWYSRKQSSGSYPYIIPTGGSNALGTVGFVNAAFELKEQILLGKAPEPDRIYVACAGMATTVGLILGCKLAQLKTQIIPVIVGPEDTPGQYKAGIKRLFNETITLLRSYDPSIPLLQAPEDIAINYDFCGTKYGIFTLQGMDAKKLVYELENLNLDGIYTAKAFAALLDDIKNKKIKQHEVVLFWNTYCGLDFSKLTGSLSYWQLPPSFHPYFTTDVQSLDKADKLQSA